jgi:hypothetical protein
MAGLSQAQIMASSQAKKKASQPTWLQTRINGYEMLEVSYIQQFTLVVTGVARNRSCRQDQQPPPFGRL